MLTTYTNTTIDIQQKRNSSDQANFFRWYKLHFRCLPVQWKRYRRWSLVSMDILTILSPQLSRRNKNQDSVYFDTSLLSIWLKLSEICHSVAIRLARNWRECFHLPLTSTSLISPTPCRWLLTFTPDNMQWKIPQAVPFRIYSHIISLPKKLPLSQSFTYLFFPIMTTFNASKWNSWSF